MKPSATRVADRHLKRAASERAIIDRAVKLLIRGPMSMSDLMVKLDRYKGSMSGRDLFFLLDNHKKLKVTGFNPTMVDLAPFRQRA